MIAAPTSAVTGAFFVKQCQRYARSEAIRAASACGVPVDRAEAYFGKHKEGWIIEVAAAYRFPTPLSYEELRRLNHYFTVPQAYAYLPRFEALTQALLDRAVSVLAEKIVLRDAVSLSSDKIADLIISNVSAGYDDIDEDFVEQTSGHSTSSMAAFSTSEKKFLEVCVDDVVLGYTTITRKYHGAWKTGPTILLPEYQGLNVGAAVRSAIEGYSWNHGARAIYCTCPANASNVVSYLIRSGMNLQARLKAHLSSTRDELVFSKANEKSKRPRKRPLLSDMRDTATRSVRRIASDDPLVRIHVAEFTRLLGDWYFSAPPKLSEAIIAGMEAFDSGTYKYSAKPKELYISKDRAGRTRIAVLLTHKRSGMIKLNVVATTSNVASIESVLQSIFADHKLCRRYYLTVPCDRPSMLTALSSSGFSVEGLLNQPFGDGRDHICFGIVRAASEAAPRLSKSA